MIVLASLGVILFLTGHPISHVDMLLGMGLGISTAPIMMETIKRWRTKRKVNRMLTEMVKLREAKTSIEEEPEVHEERIVV